MHRDGEADTASRLMDESCRRLWRAVVKQTLRNAQPALPSGQVSGAEMKDSARKASVTLDVRVILTDPRQAAELRMLLDLAGMETIALTAYRQVQAVIDADAAGPSRAGWYKTGGG